jgi:hypothetical protein
MKILVVGLLVLSLALNAFLWSRLSSQGDQLKSAQASASEIDELRRQYQELQANLTNRSDVASADAIELARLRNEIGQLRRNAGDSATMRKQVEEIARLRLQLATATQDLARAKREFGDVVKLSPEQLQQLKAEAQSVACVNNMKQICLAAHLWAVARREVFPPDFISMKEELETPRVLFCPADTAAIRATEWSQLNPSSISYRFLNPNGRDKGSTNLFATCLIHGHIALSDGSVHRR